METIFSIPDLKALKKTTNQIIKTKTSFTSYLKPFSTYSVVHTHDLIYTSYNL